MCTANLRVEMLITYVEPKIDITHLYILKNIGQILFWLVHKMCLANS